MHPLYNVDDNIQNRNLILIIAFNNIVVSKEHVAMSNLSYSYSLNSTIQLQTSHFTLILRYEFCSLLKTLL